MPTPGTTSSGLTPLVVELGLTTIAIVLAFCFPELGARLFSGLERFFSRLAAKRALSVFVCGVTPCLIRILLLPLHPIPKPWIQDDFSFLLAADTFAAGHLTNPTPPLWTHFESFHITLVPTYMSMYFPAQGMIMAAGKILAGHPWFGVLASCGLMCAGICWALQGWLPSGWALLGGLLAGLRLALFSYWIETYTGGAVAAFGGALVLGALPRIQRHFRALDFFWMALGMAILANSRPYEGLLVSAAAAGLIAWSFWRRSHPAPVIVLRRLLPAAALLISTLVFMGYYDYRLYGNVFTLPYTINRETYSVAPHFLWQSPRPVPAYRHLAMRNYYAGQSPQAEPNWFFRERSSIKGFARVALLKLTGAEIFYVNFAMAPLLFALPWVLRDKRIRPAVIMALVFAAGLAVETWFIPHYAAPAVALLYLILLQCARHLRQWGGPGLMLVRAVPVLCVALVIIRVTGHLSLPDDARSTQSWYGSGPIGLERARIASQLEQQPGRQLAVVRYVPDHLYPEWVYNGPDIEGSRVIWAREMDAADNRELLTHFKDRTAWLVEPDVNPPRVSRYPSPEQ